MKGLAAKRSSGLLEKDFSELMARWEAAYSRQDYTAWERIDHQLDDLVRQLVLADGQAADGLPGSTQPDV